MSEPRPPQSRLRRVYKVIYWVISLNLMLSTAVGVTVYVFRSPEGSGPQVSEVATATSDEGLACRADLEKLFGQLQQQVQTALARGTSPTLAHDWQDFTQAWRQSLDQVRYRCRLDTPPMAPLAELARDLEKLRVSYTTAVNGFADTGQGTLERIRATLGRAAGPESRN